MNIESYEFLKGFEARMNIIGSISSFIIKLVNSQRFKEKLNQYELINLSVAVLSYLLEMSLTKEGLTIIQIKDYILWVLNNNFQKDISDEEALDIARFLIRDVFMNSGEYYTFQVFNFEEKKFTLENYQLVKDKIDADDNLKYVLSDLGNDFLIRTKEIDQHLHISMQQIIAMEFIKRKDFKNANIVAKDLLLAVYKEKQNVESFVDKIKTSDILSIDIEEYKSKLFSIFDILKSQQAEVETIIKLVEQAESEFLKLGIYNKKVEELKIVKNTLTKIRKEHISLLSQRYEIDEAYEEAIINAMSMGLERRFDFKETIINPIKDNPELLESVGELMRPLYKVHVPKYYNLFKAYERQQMLKPNLETKVEGINLTVDKGLIEKRKEDEEIKHKKYLTALRYILDVCIKYDGLEVNLLKIINEMDIKSKLEFIDYDEDKVFFKIITFMFTGRTIYVDEILENKKDEGTLTIQGLIKELCEVDEKYKKIFSINVYKDFDTEELNIDGLHERRYKNSNYEVLREYTITNYKLKVVCTV